ncbi:YggS family pyridoxal phosphate-dependent enzyme [Bacillus horti]|uniref:Pyridoxal phosphate homeostasis protein n=1 Tax=Caldalkalibacillus horti TaxID=77523 RepID=A0ABT9VUF9_9BACI|nr:YggS family pyridoxal phosphate-dependent enzyme [Bacillus horti]MDQ0164622.1 pyridoxal phosphate enzyme (YggS family) [Bacillus horti]
MASVAENWQDIEQQIQRACEKSSRKPNDINVIAVTKYVNTERMIEALEAGIEHIGENKVQDALPKWETLGDKGIWHFIGHLQSNKVKDVIGRFHYIHSLDRHSLAKEIEKRASAKGITVSCFVQVNVSGEQTKQGIAFSEAKNFVEDLRIYSHIKVVGLMTMAPYEAEPESVRPVFSKLKQLQEELRQHHWSHAPLTELSMGMSNDFQVAIEEGATFVRLGTSLVGNDEK